MLDLLNWLPAHPVAAILLGCWITFTLWVGLVGVANVVQAFRKNGR